MRNEVNTVIMNTTAATKLVSGVSYLCGIQVHTALTGTLVVGGFLDDTGTAANFTFPAGSVGTLIPPGAKMRAVDLTITMSNAADKLKAAISWASA